MSVTTPNRIVDVRSLPGSREVIAYKDGGLFPVLDMTADGIAVAALRGGGGHIALAGRMDIIRSLDGGLTWTPPNVVADSELDDRNPAFGVSPAGTLILAYARADCYDEDGVWQPKEREASGKWPWQMMVTRSHDKGLTWETPYPLSSDDPRPWSPFGKIVALADGTLLITIYYSGTVYQEYGESFSENEVELARSGVSCQFVLRSHDDGLTWGEPSLIALNMGETALLALPDGDVLAVMRESPDQQALYTTRSSDGGFTWSEPVQITNARQHPGDLILLANGDILLAYGNRNPPYRIEGRISRDGGRSWLDCLLTFSGHLYGYTVNAPRTTDLGYPSSVVRGGQGITMYYYTPSIARKGWTTHLAQDYYAVAVTWDEAELVAAVDQAVTDQE